MIAVVRATHGLLVVLFVGAVGIVYYGAVAGTINVWFYLATAVIAFEAVVITLTRGNCPFLYLHRRYGDEKRLLELIMPWRFARYVFAFAFLVVAVGYALLLLDLD